MTRRKIFLKHLFFTAIILTVFTTSLSAKGKNSILQLRAGGWTGTHTSELENRYFLDDLLYGTELYRLNFPWNEAYTQDAPVGFRFYHPFQEGEIVLGAQYVRHTPDYNYMGLYFYPSDNEIQGLSLMSLDNYSSYNLEGDLGYRLEVAPKTSITARVGYREHSKSYDYYDLTIGDDWIIFTMNGPFEASSRSTYVGGTLEYEINSKFSVSIDYDSTSPLFGNLDGKMNSDVEKIGLSDTNDNYIYYRDSAKSDYRINFTRYSISGKYMVSKNLGVELGLRQETMKTEYPQYWNVPIIIVDNELEVDDLLEEFVIDQYFIYKNQEISQKGMIYAGITYDINVN